MKYIRTKDGRIYEIIEETENSFELCSPFEKRMGCSCIMIKRMLVSNEKPTYRVANTIEELCDEYVVFNPTVEQKEYLVEWLGKDKIKYKTGQQQEGFIVSYETLFGAIWTEWGLKYVAKMNDKGELELC